MYIYHLLTSESSVGDRIIKYQLGKECSVPEIKPGFSPWYGDLRHST